MSIADLPHADLHEVSPNEIGFDQKSDAAGMPTWDDPTKLRFGAFRRSWERVHQYLGVIGLDLLRRRSDGSVARDEKGFIAFKLDSNDGQPALPCVEFHLQRTAESSDDEDMLCVLRISAKGIELDPKGRGGMTISGCACGGGGGGRVTRYYTDGPPFLVNMQDDTGKPTEVIYHVLEGRPESEWPVYSARTLG